MWDNEENQRLWQDIVFTYHQIILHCRCRRSLQAALSQTWLKFSVTFTSICLELSCFRIAHPMLIATPTTLCSHWWCLDNSFLSTVLVKKKHEYLQCNKFIYSKAITTCHLKIEFNFGTSAVQRWVSQSIQRLLLSLTNVFLKLQIHLK